MRAAKPITTTEAGVSRPTVYAHFSDGERLIGALVERGVRHAMATLESADPERGAAGEALERVLAASWEALGRNEAIARAAAAKLGADAMREAHAAARAVLLELVSAVAAKVRFAPTSRRDGW